MILTVVVATLVGGVLRFHGIANQLLISDEWHGLYVAASRSYGELSQSFTIGATSPPMNMLQRFMLEHVGWTEIALRMPSLIAGMALLLTFPLIIRAIASPGANLIATSLLAISPSLIYFSRYVRPYSIVVLLAFVAIMSAYQWARSGHQRYVWIFAGAAVLAAYFHLLELRIAALCFTGLVLAKLWDVRHSGKSQPMVKVSFRALAALGTGLFGILAIIILPGLLTGEGTILGATQRAPVKGETLVQAFGLLVGLPGSLGLILVFLVALHGMVAIWRRDPFLSGFLCFVSTGCIAVVLIMKPNGSNLPEILARYLVPGLPILMLSIGCGVADILERTSHTSWGRRIPSSAWQGGGIVVVVAFYLLGPLPSLYGGQNDFTNHKAFQYSYASLPTPAARFAQYRSRASLGAAQPRMSAFYEQLADDIVASTIIEFPILVGDKFVPYPVYQAVHGKRILGGYQKVGLSSRRRGAGYLYAIDPVGVVLDAVGSDRTVSFRNYVDIDDSESIKRSKADYLVIHLDLNREMAGMAGLSPEGESLAARWKGRLGRPFYEDHLVLVFALTSS